MPKKFFPILLSLLFSAIAFTGCETFQSGVKQDVTVQSFPSGAQVYVDGDYMGTTPVAVPLGRLVQHNIVLEKAGYDPYQELVTPERVGGKGFIRFGLMEDTGMYNALRPDPVEMQLRPEIVPESRSPYPFDEFVTLQTFLDQELERGRLNAVEHKYMSEKLREHYRQ